MKNWRFYSAVAAMLTLAAAFTAPSWADEASPEEAWIVAENYVELIVNRKGDWGGTPDAHVVAMDEFMRGDRLLGYSFQVAPQGFILTSLHKELPPVKAYSATSNLDPGADVGLVDLVKGRMEQTIVAVETDIGKPIARATTDDWAMLIETDYRPAWLELTDKDFDASQYYRAPRTTSVGMDYQEGEVLLTTEWHQQPPYNDQCPDLGCDAWSGPPYYGYNTNARVGCVATAGAQILKYWHWPPCSADGEYVDRFRWSNMPNVATIDSPQDQIDCVAAACHAVGVAVSMDYGCDASGAVTFDMEQVFENRRYHENCNHKMRIDYSNSEWFDLLRDQFNLNRPVQYRIDGHSIVGDGWQIIDIGGVPTAQVHMNYGWGNSFTAWYHLDDLHLGEPDIEYVIRTIFPENAMGDNLYGHHPTVWEAINHFDKPTRYLNQDASAVYAEFDAGQAFQYLRPGLHIQHIGPYGDAAFIQFNGEPDAVSEIYYGAPDGDVKIRITDGAIKFQNGGEMCLH